MKPKIKEITIVILLIFTSISCGFAKKTVTLDTENRILFQNSSVEKLALDADKEKELIKEKYDDSYYVVLGKIEEISKNNKTVVIGDLKKSHQMTIECSVSDKSIVSEIKALKVDDIVKVYGKIKVGMLSKEVSIDALRIVVAETEETVETAYSFIDGTAFDAANMITRSLAGEKVQYYIPHNWTSVEKNIIEYGLGSIEGYQYALNEIPGELAVEPESIFVCYFDSKAKLEEPSRISETKAIRKTIISNILKMKVSDVKNSKIIKKKTYYGAEYYYYDGKYEDKQGQAHRVEFVFQEIGNEGMIMYLYVFREKDHIDDILGVMRCMVVK